MTSYFRTACVAVLVLGLTGCQDSADTTTATEEIIKATETSGNAGGAVDTATPEGVVEAFLDAIRQRDVATMGSLLADDAAAEFDVLRNGTMTAEDLDGLAQLFEGAQVAGREEDGDRVGVQVVGGQRDETIWVAPTAGGYGIVDF